MRKSIVTAAVFAALVGGWVLSGQFGAQDVPPEPRATADDPNSGPKGAAEPRKIPQVRVRTLVAQERANRLLLVGRTEASRVVTLRIQTAGRIAEVVAKQGGRLEKGAVIARIDMEDRQSRLAEAKALVNQREIEFQAAKELSRRDFRSKTQLAGAESQLSAARAALARIRTDIAHTEVRAPFAGILDSRQVEVGDFLDVGDPVATMVDLDPIKVVSSVTERDVDRISIGAPASAKLATGQVVDGTIGYLSSVAQGGTRTFPVEFEAANPNHAVVGGVTAELSIRLDNTLAHFVSPAVLTLNDEGLVGVKLVGTQNRVRFHEVKLLADEKNGIWLAGLPERVTVITVGQEFVQDGQLVTPVVEDASPLSQATDRDS